MRLFHISKEVPITLSSGKQISTSAGSAGFSVSFPEASSAFSLEASAFSSEAFASLSEASCASSFASSAFSSAAGLEVWELSAFPQAISPAIRTQTMISAMRFFFFIVLPFSMLFCRPPCRSWICRREYCLRFLVDHYTAFIYKIQYVVY